MRLPPRLGLEAPQETLSIVSGLCKAGTFLVDTSSFSLCTGLASLLHWPAQALQPRPPFQGHGPLLRPWPRLPGAAERWAAPLPAVSSAPEQHFGFCGESCSFSHLVMFWKPLSYLAHSQGFSRMGALCSVHSFIEQSAWAAVICAHSQWWAACAPPI